MIDRRTFLGCGALAVAGLLLDDSSLYSGRGAVSPTVVTTAGKVRGVTANKVHAFKGIPLWRLHRWLTPIPPCASAAALDGRIGSVSSTAIARLKALRR